MASYPDPNPVGYHSVTFQVNLQTVDRYSFLVPSTTQPEGNEVTAEADNFKNTRSTWAPSLLHGNYTLKDGDTFTASGTQAVYLQNLYVSNPVSPNDLLQVVSITP